ncbi:MAG: tetratricopeptide repeat protein [Sneathiella sp.]|nr:tetratricopeptide repeat protein [Sneathiella sp.]
MNFLVLLVVTAFLTASATGANATEKKSTPITNLSSEVLKAEVNKVCHNGPNRKPNWGRSAADLHVRQGWKMVTKGMGDDASQAFLVALHVGPERPDAYWGLGVATHLANFPFVTIKSCFNRAFKLLPNVANPHADYGNVLIQRDLHDEAMSQFQTALKIDNDNIGALVGIARLYHKTNRLPEAKNIMKRIEEIEKKSKTK